MDRLELDMGQHSPEGLSKTGPLAEMQSSYW